ncbi:hypothetical protein GCM10017687_46440 [Streptomyces echinatus]
MPGGTAAGQPAQGRQGRAQRLLVDLVEPREVPADQFGPAPPPVREAPFCGPGQQQAGGTAVRRVGLPDQVAVPGEPVDQGLAASGMPMPGRDSTSRSSSTSAPRSGEPAGKPQEPAGWPICTYLF